MNAQTPRSIPEQPAREPIRDDAVEAHLEVGSDTAVSSQDNDFDLQALARIAQEYDAPPSIVDELAMAAFETRHLDLQFAALIADSEIGSELVRSVDAGPRMISFECGDISVELQLTHTGEKISVNGLVIGATGSVVIQTSTGSLEAAIDEAGWFARDGVVTGALRLRLIHPNGSGVVTEWITT